MAETVKEKREEEDNQKGLTEGKGRATPSRRKGETQHTHNNEPSGNFIVRSTQSVRNYFGGVRSEMQKVTWPTREETQRLSWIVAIVLVASAIFLGAMAGLFTYIFNMGVDQPIIFIGVFVAFLLVLFGYSRYASKSETAEF